MKFSEEKVFFFKIGILVSFIFYFLIINLSTHNEIISPEIIREFKLKIYPYSGFHKESFLKFSNNIELFGKNPRYVDISSEYLYKALDDARDLLFYSTRDFSDKIHEIAVEGEHLLLKSSLKYGTLFIPKYLNN